MIKRSYTDAMSAVLQQESDRPRGRGRPPLSPSDVAKRRAAVIEVATQFFIAEGYVNTTLDEIARVAGFPKRTIYELFGGKQALFQAACNSMRAKGPGFAFDVVLAGRSVRDVLMQMARQLIDHSLRHELVTLERAIIAEASRSAHVVRDTVAESKQNLFTVIGEIFERLTASRQMGVVDNRKAAELFYDAVVGARGFRAVLGVPEVPASDHEIGDRVDMFLHGYVAYGGPVRGILSAPDTAWAMVPTIDSVRP